MLGWVKKKIQRAEYDIKVKKIWQAMGVAQDLREPSDYGALRSCCVDRDMPDLNGFQEKVSIVRTSNGVSLIKQSSGEPIADMLLPSPEKMKEIPADIDEGTFVYLVVRGKYKGIEDKVCSCFIESQSGEFYGDARAFWWSLAKVNVSGVLRAINHTRMTKKARIQVRAAAQGLWQSAVEHEGSIEHMRDTLVLARNTHLQVFSKMKEEWHESASCQFGVDIVSAMILAVQSEDPKLEAVAFDRLKEFIWERGKEPEEFLCR